MGALSMACRLVCAAVLAATSSPALATGGFECRPISGAGPIITVGLGHSIAARPLFGILRDGGRTLSTQGPRATLFIGQIWIDNRHLWLDLTDANVTRHEAKLRASFPPGGRMHLGATGTLWRGGRAYRVRCVEA